MTPPLGMDWSNWFCWTIDSSDFKWVEVNVEGVFEGAGGVSPSEISNELVDWRGLLEEAVLPITVVGTAVVEEEAEELFDVSFCGQWDDETTFEQGELKS